MSTTPNTSLNTENSGEHSSMDRAVPVTEAVLQRNYSLVEELLKTGCDVNRINQKGFSPLFYALRYNDGTTRGAAFLIRRGADINQILNDSPLIFHFIRPFSLEKLEYLITAGADLSLRDKKGRNLLQALLETSAVDDGDIDEICCIVREMDWDFTETPEQRAGVLESLFCRKFSGSAFQKRLFDSCISRSLHSHNFHNSHNSHNSHNNGGGGGGAVEIRNRLFVTACLFGRDCFEWYHQLLAKGYRYSSQGDGKTLYHHLLEKKAFAALSALDLTPVFENKGEVYSFIKMVMDASVQKRIDPQGLRIFLVKTLSSSSLFRWVSWAAEFIVDFSAGRENFAETVLLDLWPLLKQHNVGGEFLLKAGIRLHSPGMVEFYLKSCPYPPNTFSDYETLMPVYHYKCRRPLEMVLFMQTDSEYSRQGNVRIFQCLSQIPQFEIPPDEGFRFAFYNRKFAAADYFLNQGADLYYRAPVPGRPDWGDSKFRGIPVTDFTYLHDVFPKYGDSGVTYQDIIEQIEYLLEKGMDINIADSHCITVLHVAASYKRKNQHKIVRYLLDRGADPLIPVTNTRGKALGKTAVYFAKDTRIIQILKERGKEGVSEI